MPKHIQELQAVEETPATPQPVQEEKKEPVHPLPQYERVNPLEAVARNVQPKEKQEHTVEIKTSEPAPEVIEEKKPAELTEEEKQRQTEKEYILIKGVNDSIEDAKKLERLIRPTFGYVNLIPYNPVVENGYERADDESVTLFHNYLLSKKVKSTIRKEFGSDIDAACGQLRAKYER